MNFNKIEGNDVIRTALNKVFGDFKKDPMVESIRFSVNHLHTWIDKTSISTLVFPQENKGAVQF